MLQSITNAMRCRTVVDFTKIEVCEEDGLREICDFTQQDAEVLCRQLSFSDTGSLYTRFHVHEVNVVCVQVQLLVDSVVRVLDRFLLLPFLNAMVKNRAYRIVLRQGSVVLLTMKWEN